jgi:hypothetical protein
LSIAEGDRGLLLRCWAGCSAEEIVSALGLNLTDLFFDVPHNPGTRRRPGPTPRRFDFRKTAARLLDHADGLWLRAQNVLEVSKGLDCSAWTDADIETAMHAVASAYQDLERAELLRDVAVNIRLRGLAQEQERRVKNDARAA